MAPEAPASGALFLGYLFGDTFIGLGEAGAWHLLALWWNRLGPAFYGREQTGRQILDLCFEPAAVIEPEGKDGSADHHFATKGDPEGG